MAVIKLQVLCIVLMAQSGDAFGWCPLQAQHFEVYVDACYNSVVYKKDDPDGNCREFMQIADCLDGWLARCSHRPWITQKREEIKDVSDWLRTDCALFEK